MKKTIAMILMFTVCVNLSCGSAWAGLNLSDWTLGLDDDQLRNIYAAQKFHQLEYSGDVMLKSAYYAPTNILAYEGWSLQTSFSVTDPKSGLSWNVWHNGEFGRQIFDKDNDFAAEVDMGPSLYTELGGGWWMNLRVDWWNYNNLNSTTTDTLYTSAEFSRVVTDSGLTSVFIKPAAYIVKDMPWDGWGLTVGLRGSIPTPRELGDDTVVAWEFYELMDDGVYGFEPAVTVGGTLDMEWVVNDDFVLKAPYLNYMGGQRGETIIYGAGIAFSFK